MPVNFNFMVKKGGKLSQSSLLKPAQNINLQGVKCARKPISRMATLTNCAQFRDNIDEVVMLRNAGVTQSAIAERFGISRNSVQRYLRDFYPDAIPENVKFARASKSFFLASTPEEKEKAFEAVDPFLQKFAKERHKLQNSGSFEDCLQELRLEFLEAKPAEIGQNYNFSNFVQRFKQKITPIVPDEKPVLVPLSEIENNGKYIAKTDKNISSFVDMDYKTKQIQNSSLTPREHAITDLLLFKNKTIGELEEKLWLTKARIKQIIYENIVPKIENYKDLPRKQ